MFLHDGSRRKSKERMQSYQIVQSVFYRSEVGNTEGTRNLFLISIATHEKRNITIGLVMLLKCNMEVLNA